jgi:hypothetical protein
MREDNFLTLLKSVAKEQSALGRERLVPEKLSDVANFVAIYLWQTIAGLALLSTIFWNLLKKQL